MAADLEKPKSVEFKVWARRRMVMGGTCSSFYTVSAANVTEMIHGPLDKEMKCSYGTLEPLMDLTIEVPYDGIM